MAEVHIVFGVNSISVDFTLVLVESALPTVVLYKPWPKTQLRPSIRYCTFYISLIPVFRTPYLLALLRWIYLQQPCHMTPTPNSPDCSHFRSNTDLVDIESPLSDEELYVLSQQYNNEGDFVSVQTRFNYAWGLIKSRKVEDQQLGVQILAQVYKDTPSRRRECLYYLAIGSYKLGEYTDARKYCDLLLQIEPDDPQSAKLRQIIEDKLAKEGMIGIAIVGGVIAVGAAVLGAVLSQKKR